LNPRKKIGVMLVDDSLVDLKVLERMLAVGSDIEILGTARNGREALNLLPKLKPQVVCTDLHMPDMDGMMFTKAAMAEHPVPILVVSSHVGEEKKQTVFDLLQAGAVDVFPKPRAGLADPEICRALVEKVRILSGVFVFRKTNTQGSTPSRPLALPYGNRKELGGVVALGTSTGGPPALAEVLGALDESFPVPILCVQHIGKDFLAGLVSWLCSQTRLQVKVCEVGERLMPGTVYFSLEGSHLTVGSDDCLATSYDLPWQGHRPSVNHLFLSVAKHYGKRGVGVLLTGMGKDGAEGLMAIRQAGGRTIAQDEQSSVVFGMPKAAIDLGAAQKVMALRDVGPTLVQWAYQRQV
jgi:two-component system, chemotaxis family, protein-glutamate methylesterase/glutaminase